MGILIILLGIVIVLGIPIAIIAGIVYLVRRRGPSAEIKTADRAGLPVAWDRGFIYLLSFAGFMATLFAVSSMAGLVVAATVPQFSAMLSGQDTRTRASYYLAALIVGLPLWLGLWLAGQRRVRRSPVERTALERRLYLAGIFAATSIVVLFASHTLVNALLTLPGGGNRTGSVRDSVLAAIQILTYGVAWIAYARLGRSERSPGEGDGAHDLAVYAVAGFSVVFLSYGLGEATRQVVLAILDRSSSALLTSTSGGGWRTWGEIASWLLAGGIIWAAIWRYDLARGGRRLILVGSLAGAAFAVAFSIKSSGRSCTRATSIRPGRRSSICPSWSSSAPWPATTGSFFDARADFGRRIQGRCASRRSFPAARRPISMASSAEAGGRSRLSATWTGNRPARLPAWPRLNQS